MQIRLPWAAWYEDTNIEISFPEHCSVDYYSLRQNRTFNLKQLDEKFQELTMLLRQKTPEKVIIVVDDLTRPVLLKEILQFLLKLINGSGVRRENVTILIGLGTHRPLTYKDVCKKLGEEVVDKFRWINHSTEQTEPSGVHWGEHEIGINSHYLRADFRIVISALTPHAFAGFSGGAKMLVPGIADMETITKTHKSVLMGFMGKLAEVENNKFRHLIENFAEKIGIDFFVGIVPNTDRGIAEIFCGDFKKEHRKAAHFARAYLSTPLKTVKPYDMLVLNAYPKDTELLQSETAFIPFKSTRKSFLKENAQILVTSACSEGVGYHGLFGPGGRLYKRPNRMRILGGRKLLFFSPNIDIKEFNLLYGKDYQFFSEKLYLEDYLARTLPKDGRVAVFPYASMQLIEI